MIAVLYAGAVLAFAGTAALYFHGRFIAALGGALAFGGLIGRAAWGAMGPVAASIALVVLLIAPYAYVGVHIVDARKGLFLLPTIYSIPLAFLAGAALLLATGVALVL